MIPSNPTLPSGRTWVTPLVHQEPLSGQGAHAASQCADTLDNGHCSNPMEDNSCVQAMC